MEDDLIRNLSIILLDPNVAPNGPKQGMAPNGLKQTCPKTIHLAHTLYPYSKTILSILYNMYFILRYIFSILHAPYTINSSSI
jgi:hypothetical protein